MRATWSACIPGLITAGIKNTPDSLRFYWGLVCIWISIYSFFLLITSTVSVSFFLGNEIPNLPSCCFALWKDLLFGSGFSVEISSAPRCFLTFLCDDPIIKTAPHFGQMPLGRVVLCPWGHSKVPLLPPIHHCGCPRGGPLCRGQARMRAAVGTLLFSLLLPSCLLTLGSPWALPSADCWFQCQRLWDTPLLLQACVAKFYVLFEFCIFQKADSFEYMPLETISSDMQVFRFSPATVVLVVRVFVTHSHYSYLEWPKLGYFARPFCRKRSVLKVTSWVFLAPLPRTTCSLKTHR